MKKKAFTLAETLMTLIVIGLISALVVPQFYKGIQDNLYDKQKKNFESTLRESLAKMRVDGQLNKDYATTKDFAEALQKYSKIAKICSNDEIEKCFTAKKYEDSDKNKTYTIKDLNSADKLVPQSSWDADVVGVVFSDGVQALMTRNPDADYISPYNSEADLMGDIAVLYDVNPGKRTPDRTGDDMEKINMDPDVDFKYEILSSVPSINSQQCNMVRANHPEIQTACTTRLHAVYAACDAKGMKPATEGQLQQILDKLKLDSNACANKKIVNKLGISNSNVFLGFGGGERSNHWYNYFTVYCNKNGTISYGLSTVRDSSSTQRIICVEEQN